jgi:hypothetical protein
MRRAKLPVPQSACGCEAEVQARLTRSIKKQLDRVLNVVVLSPRFKLFVEGALTLLHPGTKLSTRDQIESLPLTVSCPLLRSRLFHVIEGYIRDAC